MRRTAYILLGVLAGVVLLAGLVGAPALWRTYETIRHIKRAAAREPQARKAWSREFGDSDEAFKTLSKQRENPAALRLVELVRPLGVALARPEPERPKLVQAAGDRAVNQAVDDYVRSELTKSQGSVEPPPETVRAFLESCSHDINAIGRFLTTSGAIVWESDDSLGSEAPVPNLLGQVQLQRALIADALNRFRSGRTSEAGEVLEASWALNGSLRGRTDVVSQLIAVAAARMEVGLVRRIEADPALWHTRLAQHDYRASLLRAIEVESVSQIRRLSAGGSEWDRAARADFFDLRRGLLVAMRESPVSDGTGEDLLPREDRSPEAGSLGAILEAIAAPNLAGASKRVDRLIVDTELSERILEARVLRSRLGRWPAALPGSEETSVPGARWKYSVDKNGRVSISFSRELRWGDQRGIVLPLRYSAN